MRALGFLEEVVMAGGAKPSAKIALKPAGGGDRTYIAAAWRRDDGRMGGLVVDKRVTQIAVQLDDGTVIRMKRGADNKMSHYLDLFLEDERAPSAVDPKPWPDYGDDSELEDSDIPF